MPEGQGQSSWLQGEKKIGVAMVVHGWERDDNFLDNFTFSKRTTFHSGTVNRRNGHIW